MNKIYDSIANSTGIFNSILEPNTILMLLLLTDILMHINRLSLYSQTKNVVFAKIASKFKLLGGASDEICKEDSKEFKSHTEEFLATSKII